MPTRPIIPANRKSPAKLAKEQAERFKELKQPWIEELICLIICLRRELDVEKNLYKFRRLVLTNSNHLHNLTARWLASILLTYVDYGTEKERYEASIVNSYVLYHSGLYVFKERLGWYNTTPIEPLHDFRLLDKLARDVELIETPVIQLMFKLILIKAFLKDENMMNMMPDSTAVHSTFKLYKLAHLLENRELKKRHEVLHRHRQLHEQFPEYGTGNAELNGPILERWVASESKSILDYGCGKGELVKEYDITGYDPAVTEYSIYPSQQFDTVVAFNVCENFLRPLSHEIELLSARAIRQIIISVECGPSEYAFPDESDINTTILTPAHWHTVLAERLPNWTMVATVSDGDFFLMNLMNNKP